MKRPDQSARIRAINYRHGYTGTPTWVSWSAMLNRCRNVNAADYKRYGGRGISVCQSWLDFVEFLRDMGIRPEGTTLGRIDNDGDYEPSNCRWETAKDQGRNTRSNVLLTYNGETRTVVEWAEHLHVSAPMIYQRIASEWPVEEALTIPSGMSRPSRPKRTESLKTHCKRGHPLSGDNLRVNKKGQRSCWTCNRILNRERHLAARMAS